MKKTILSILSLCVSINIASQESTSPNPIQERVRRMESESGAMPLIICNEKEMSPEEFLSLDASKYGTCIFLNIKNLAQELAGERGENGLIYVHDKRNYLPFPDDGGYFAEGDFPAEFPGGTDSLYIYTASHQRVSKEVLKSDLQGETEVLCFIGEDGAVDSCEVLSMELREPQSITIYFQNGNTPPTPSVIEKKTLKLLGEIANSAVEVCNSFPAFSPAIFYLRPAKYKKRIFIPFRYGQAVGKGNRFH